MQRPVAMCVEVLPSRHFGRHMAQRRGVGLDPRITPDPLGKFIGHRLAPSGLDRRAARRVRQFDPSPGVEPQRGCRRIEARLAVPHRGPAGIAPAVEPVVPWAQCAPAAFGHGDFDACCPFGRGDLQRDAARDEFDHRALFVERTQDQVGTRADAHRGRTQPQQRAAIEVGLDPFTASQRPTVGLMRRGGARRRDSDLAAQGTDAGHDRARRRFGDLGFDGAGRDQQ